MIFAYVDDEIAAFAPVGDRRAIEYVIEAIVQVIMEREELDKIEEF